MCRPTMVHVCLKNIPVSKHTALHFALYASFFEGCFERTCALQNILFLVMWTNSHWRMCLRRTPRCLTHFSSPLLHGWKPMSSTWRSQALQCTAHPSPTISPLPPGYSKLLKKTYWTLKHRAISNTVSFFFFFRSISSLTEDFNWIAP